MNFLGRRVILKPRTDCRFLAQLRGCAGTVNTVEVDESGVLMYRVHLDATPGEGFFWYAWELDVV